MAQEQENQQTLDQWIAELKEEISKNPGAGRAHYNLGVAYVSESLPDQAIEEF
ncbi:MAG: hypothetical protein JRE23_08685 [Deltaproteobacteria bacterium]|nr:hypothetical protein [Deltaproteobacteria bacterium]